MLVADNIFNDLERNPAATVYCDTAFNSMPSIAARAPCGSKKKISHSSLWPLVCMSPLPSPPLPRAVTLN